MSNAADCAYYEFTCNDGTCVDQRRRCDQRYDCPDYSDELNCGRIVLTNMLLILTNMGLARGGRRGCRGTH